MNRIVSFRRLLLAVLLAFVTYIVLRSIIPLIDVKIFSAPQDRDVISNFIQWFGVIYGLIIAFFLIESWTNYNRVVEEIDKEADALTMLYWSALTLGNEICKPITDAIMAYSTMVIRTHNTPEKRKFSIRFHALFKHRESRVSVDDLERNPEFDKAVYRLHEVVDEALNKTDNIPIGIAMINLLNEALDTRGDRLQHAENKVPDLLWWTLILTSVLWLMAFLGLEIKNLWLAIWVVGTAIFSVTLLLFIIKDLENPFTGAMKVDFSPFEKLQENIDRWGKHGTSD